MHPTRDELLAWRDTPSDAERGRIVGHLAICDDCGAAYAELIRIRPAEVPASAFDARAFADRGYAALPSARPRAFWRQPRVVVSLAAAAALILALALPAIRDEERVAGDPHAVRGGSVEGIGPVGNVNGPLEFRWQSPFLADRYVVEVVNPAGAIVLTRETRADRLALDADSRATLAPGVRYAWTVRALDKAGETIARSNPRSFTIVPIDR